MKVTNKTDVTLATMLIEMIMKEMKLHVNGKLTENVVIENFDTQRSIAYLNIDGCSFLVKFTDVKETKTNKSFFWDIYLHVGKGIDADSVKYMSSGVAVCKKGK